MKKSDAVLIAEFDGWVVVGKHPHIKAERLYRHPYREKDYWCDGLEKIYSSWNGLMSVVEKLMDLPECRDFNIGNVCTMVNFVKDDGKNLVKQFFHGTGYHGVTRKDVVIKAIVEILNFINDKD